MKKTIAVVVSLLTAAPVFAQQPLDQLMEQVRQQWLELSSDNQSRLNITDRGQLAQLTADTQAALDAANRQSDQLNERFAANKLALEQMANELAAETGQMRDVFAVVRQYAGDAGSLVRSSLVSAQLGNRMALLSRLADSGTIAAPEDLHDFHLLLLGEMTQSGKVARFPAEIVSAAGVPVTTDVVRVGTFNLIADDKFLRYDVSNGTIGELARQPARRYRNDARSLFNATGGVSAMAVDPTGGQLLGLLIQTPNASERVQQGGPVGYVIIALGLLGVLIGLYRLVFLGAVSARINRQLKSDTPDPGNALGRILGVYSQNLVAHTDVLELKLEEAIIKETPALENWQAALKVIAAVAPLLGLLGTVIGMIQTFQQITLFGTSDPRLMANGISTALVTTMLGLLVAIPIVLLHSMVASRSKQLIEILEEQSAAMIATQAEKKR